MNNETHETIADIVTEMRKRAEEVYAGQSGYPESWKNQMDYGEIYDIADRIEAANKREHEATIEKSSVVGNVTKMREALLKASVVLKDAPHYLLTDEYVNECLALIYSALSEPPRNCDCHLAKNFIGAVTIYCIKNPELPPMVEWNAIQYLEFCKWLFAEAKED